MPYQFTKLITTIDKTIPSNPAIKPITTPLIKKYFKKR
jgi:hypothetical protein